MTRFSIALVGIASLALLASACDDSYDDSYPGPPRRIDAGTTPPPDAPPYNPYNNAPIVGFDYATTAADTPILVDVLANDYDYDGDPLKLVSASAPSWGTATVVDRKVRIDPQGLTGTMSLSYTITDGKLQSTGSISVYVTPGLTATSPVFNDIGSLGTEIWLDAGQSNPDLTYRITTRPTHGTLTENGSRPFYRPNAAYEGSDSFTYEVSDGKHTATGTVTLNMAVSPPLVTPVDSQVEVVEDASQWFAFTVKESDSLWAYDVVITAFPQHGALDTWSGGNTNRYYYPSPDFSGTDSLSFQLKRRSDAKVTTSATVTFTVKAVDDTPVAQGQALGTDEDKALTGRLMATDVDSATITYALVGGASSGRVTLAGDTFTYTPNGNFNGSDGFNFVAKADGATSDSKRVTIAVAAINDAPVARDSAVALGEDGPVALVLDASDVDSSLTYTVTSAPKHGSWTGTGANLTYFPATNYFGTDDLEFQVSDGLATARAKVSFTITSVNDLPIAKDDRAQIDAGAEATLSVLNNDRDVETQPLQIKEVATPAHGTATINDDGTLSYLPAAGFTGTDVFTYTAQDADGGVATANVRIGVGMFPELVPTEYMGSNNLAASAPSVSGDGRFVAFVTSAGLDNGDVDSAADVYVIDRITGELDWISAPLAGRHNAGAASRPVLSPDGNLVLFTSTSSELVVGDGNGRSDVFLRNRKDRTTQLISLTDAEQMANGPSTGYGLSNDGTRAVFTSLAFNLVERDTNGLEDVFVRDLTAGTTTRVSVTSTGGQADGASTEPVISGNGQLVAFTSAAGNLIAGDTNGVDDVFLAELATRAVSRVSVKSGASGDQANGAARGASISSDGSFVSFVSSATNLASGATTALPRVYVRERSAEPTTILGLTATDVLDARLSADGRYLLIARTAGAYLSDRFAARTVALLTTAAVSAPAISADGRYAALAVTGTSITRVAVAPKPF